MKCLLIDNHDSFTYNLYQQLAAEADEGEVLVTAVPHRASSVCALLLLPAPLVFKNDELPAERLSGLVREGSVDCIVISPGPGTPSRPSDVGELPCSVMQLACTMCDAPPSESQASACKR